jgi:hypothetical protein
MFCASCGKAEVQVLFRRIEAAPQVLRTKVDLYTVVGGLQTKQGTPFAVSDVLDLGRYQVNKRLPLGYTLSSAIAHGGAVRANQILFHVSKEFVQQASQTIAEAVSWALQNVPDKGRSSSDQYDDREDAVDEKEDDLAMFEAVQDEPEEWKHCMDRMDDGESDMMDDLFGDMEPEWFNEVDTTEDAQSRLEGHGSLPPDSMQDPRNTPTTANNDVNSNFATDESSMVEPKENSVPDLPDEHRSPDSHVEESESPKIDSSIDNEERRPRIANAEVPSEIEMEPHDVDNEHWIVNVADQRMNPTSLTTTSRRSQTLNI